MSVRTRSALPYGSYFGVMLPVFGSPVEIRPRSMHSPYTSVSPRPPVDIGIAKHTAHVASKSCRADDQQEHTGVGTSCKGDCEPP